MKTLLTALALLTMATSAYASGADCNNCSTGTVEYDENGNVVSQTWTAPSK